MQSLRLALLLLSCVALDSAVEAQSLEFLGIPAGGGHVSANGRVVTGGNSVWADGVVDSIDPLGSTSASLGHLSADGRFAVARWTISFWNFGEPPQTNHNSGMYDRMTGVLTEFEITTFPTGSCFSGGQDVIDPVTLYNPTVHDVSRDGQRAVGFRTRTFDPFTCAQDGVVWNVAAGVPVSEAIFARDVTRISGDGSRVAVETHPNGVPAMVVIEGPGAPYGITFGLPTNAHFVVVDLNDDGRRVLLHQFTPTNQWFLWHDGVLSPVLGGSAFRRMSDDASLLLSYSSVWTEELGTSITLEGYLAAHRVEAFGPDWHSPTASDLTPDGRVIVGAVTPAAGGPRELFLATLPRWRRYGLTRGGANQLELFGDGEPVLGTTFDLEVPAAPGAFVALLSSLNFGETPLLGGTLLLDAGSLLPTLIAVPDATGTAQFSIQLPLGANFDGVRLYAQAVSPDATQTGGWAISNGLRTELSVD